jgi:hypothetical protein
MATTTRFELDAGVPQTPGVGDAVEDDVGVGTGPVPPRSSFVQATAVAKSARAIQ